MPSTGTPDSPASLYGPVSLVLGVVSVAGLLVGGFVGVGIPLLAGCFAVTFGSLGLASRTRASRLKCALGLAGGAVSLLYVLYVFIGISTSM